MQLVEETDTRVHVDESTIPNAGQGVFAKEPLKKGDFLEIIGIYVKRDSLSDYCTHYANDYKFSASPLGKKIDRFVVPMGYGGMVNHSDDSEQQNCCIDHNRGPTRNTAAGKVVYRFLKDIAVGEELVGNYGEEWGRIFGVVKELTIEAEESPDEWETFLTLDLYNLGQLKEKIKE